MALLDIYWVADGDFQADFDDATFVFRVHPRRVNLVEFWPRDAETRAKARDALAAVIISGI